MLYEPAHFSRSGWGVRHRLTDAELAHAFDLVSQHRLRGRRRGMFQQAIIPIHLFRVLVVDATLSVSRPREDHRGAGPVSRAKLTNDESAEPLTIDHAEWLLADLRHLLPGTWGKHGYFRQGREIR